MEKVWILLLESNKWRLLLHICLTSKARMSQTTGAHKNMHWSELRPLLAWLANDASKKATRSGQTAGWCWCTRAISPNCQRSLLRRVHYEAIDLIVSAIDQRFNQESFSSYAQMETFLVKAGNGDDYEAEFKILEASYSKDVDSLQTADVSPCDTSLSGDERGETSAVRRLKCWYMSATWTTKHFGRYVKWREDIVFWRNPVGSVKVSRTRTKYL